MTLGWHPDPYGSHELRYFDGTSWTANVSNAGVQSIDPPPATPTAPATPSAVPPAPPAAPGAVPPGPPVVPAAAIPPAAPSSGGTSRKGLFIGLGIGGLVLLLIGAVALFALRGGDGGPGGDFGTEELDLDADEVEIREFSLRQGDSVIAEAIADDGEDIDIVVLIAEDAIDDFDGTYDDSVDLVRELGPSGDNLLEDAVEDGDLDDDIADRVEDSRGFLIAQSSSSEGEGVRFIAPIDGTYFVVFYTYPDDEGGAFESRVEPGPSFDFELDDGDDAGDVAEAYDDLIDSDDLEDFHDDSDFELDFDDHKD